MQRLTAKELQRRYRAGERNFTEVDLSGESLRGMNLKGINLSGANLSRTDIRGTNFSEANLVGAQFVAAITGTQVQWRLIQLLIASAVAVVASLCVGMFWSSVAINVFFIAGGFNDGRYTIVAFLPIILGITLAFRWNKLHFGRLPIAFWVALGVVNFLYSLVFSANSGSNSLWIFIQGFAIGLLQLFTAVFIGTLLIEINYRISRFISLSIVCARDFAGTLANLFVVLMAIIAVICGAVYGSYNNINTINIPGNELYAVYAGLAGSVISVLYTFKGASDVIKKDLISDSVGNLWAWVSF